MVVGFAKAKEGLHSRFHLDLGLLGMDQMAFLDHLLRVRRQTIHIRHLLLDHELLPIALVEYGIWHGGGGVYSLVCGLGPSWTGAPTADWRPDDVGLGGVANS